MHSEHDLQERQRRTNHSESFPLWGATFLHNPWHRGPEARWMPYAPLRRRRRPLREYSFPPIFHKSPRFPCRRRRHKKWRRRRRTSPAQRYYITSEGGALNPPVRRQPITGRTLGAQGQRPGGAINPRPRKITVGRLNGRPFYGQAKGQLRPTCTSYAGCAHQPSGILESTAQIPIPVPTAPRDA